LVSNWIPKNAAIAAIEALPSASFLLPIARAAASLGIDFGYRAVADARQHDWTVGAIRVLRDGGAL
jgi:predicted DCC family thiol-disulfide oxidoreductase YuxK